MPLPNLFGHAILEYLKTHLFKGVNVKKVKKYLSDTVIPCVWYCAEKHSLKTYNASVVIAGGIELKVILTIWENNRDIYEKLSRFPWGYILSFVISMATALELPQSCTEYRNAQNTWQKWLLAFRIIYDLVTRSLKLKCHFKMTTFRAASAEHFVNVWQHFRFSVRAPCGY